MYMNVYICGLVDSEFSPAAQRPLITCDLIIWSLISVSE